MPENEAQRYLSRRDGYRGGDSERCIIMIDAQCRGVSYDPYHWPRDTRTRPLAIDLAVDLASQVLVIDFSLLTWLVIDQLRMAILLASVSGDQSG